MCISFKLFIEILIKQPAFSIGLLVGVVYILQIVHWNPDKTTLIVQTELRYLLCISFKLFIEILIKQLFDWNNSRRAVVYILQIVHWNPDKTTSADNKRLGVLLCISFKLFIEILIKQQFEQQVSTYNVVYILQIVHWNPDKTTTGAVYDIMRTLCISFKLFIEILIKQLHQSYGSSHLCCVYPSNCSLKSW